MEKLLFDSLNEVIERCRAKAVPKEYKCSVCRDIGYIIIPQLHWQPVIKQCNCQNKQRLRAEWLEGGFNISCNNLALNNFNMNRNVVSKRMKKLAVSYIENFENNHFNRNNSIAFLGEPGTGKTHICTSIALELLRKGYRPVYFPYRDSIDSMIDCRVSDKLKYENSMSKYKKCNVLFIDDLFKGGYTEAEIRILFKIINHRYINNLPILVSSEYISTRLLRVDNAIGSRIVEMSKDNILDIVGEEYNQRLL